MTNSRHSRFMICILVLASFLFAGSACQAKKSRINPNSEAVSDGTIATGSRQINPDEVALIDDVENLLKPGEARSAYARLSKLGIGAIPAIRQMMKRQNLRLVRAALDLSEQIGSEAREARLDLAAVVSNPKLGALRTRAARILGNLGDKAGDALPQLMSAMNDPSRKVRDAVARALLDISSYGNQWGPALKQLLSAKGPWREQAVGLLVQYGPLLHPALPVIAKLIEQKPSNAGEAAALVLPQLIPGLGKFTQSADLLMTLTRSGEGEIGADDEALDEATVLADEASSFEDIAASE